MELISDAKQPRNLRKREGAKEKKVRNTVPSEDFQAFPYEAEKAEKGLCF